jgi:hypothetical protein
MYEYLFFKHCTIAKNGQKPDSIDRKQAKQADIIAGGSIPL